MRDQEKLTAGRRIVRTGPVNPSLVVYSSVIRSILALFVSGFVAETAVRIVAGGNETLGDRLVGGVIVLFAGPIVVIALRALLLQRRPVIAADQRGLSVRPALWGAVKHTPWDTVQYCEAVTHNGLTLSVQINLTMNLSSPMTPPTGIRGRWAELRRQFQVVTPLLPIRPGILADELNALSEHYQRRTTAHDPSGDRAASTAAPADRHYLSVAQLPARPDRVTGVPLPPQAPGYQPQDQQRVPDRTPAPNPPPGHGPALAWHPGAGIRSLIFLAMTLTALLNVPFVLAEGFTGLARQPLTLAVLGVLSAGCIWIFRSRPCAAGADWLARDGRWVQTYDLVQIGYRAFLNDRWLRLRDSGGRRLSVKIEDLQRDRAIWDLLYNGMLHSVIAGGARMNHQLHLILQLPYPSPGPER